MHWFWCACISIYWYEISQPKDYNVYPYRMCWIVFFIAGLANSLRWKLSECVRKRTPKRANTKYRIGVFAIAVTGRSLFIPSSTQPNEHRNNTHHTHTTCVWSKQRQPPFNRRHPNDPSDNRVDNASPFESPSAMFARLGQRANWTPLLCCAVFVCAIVSPVWGGCRDQQRLDCESVCVFNATTQRHMCTIRAAVILPNSTIVEASLQRVSVRKNHIVLKYTIVTVFRWAFWC